MADSVDTAENFDFSEPRRFLLAHAISQRHADLYIQQSSGNVAAGTADGYATSQRLNRHPAVRLTFDQQPITMYLRFYALRVALSINLLTVGDYTEHYLEENWSSAAWYLAQFCALLYNLISGATAYGAYLWYVLSMAAAILLLADGAGLGPQI